MSAYSLSVCAEMVFTELPLVERVERIHAAGFGVEIWDWSSKDIDALVATGARFTSMTGYLRGTLTDPDGADELLATAAQAIPVARRLGITTLNLHGTGLGEGGLPVRPVEVVTGAMWLAAAATLRRVAALGEREGVTFVLENLNTAVDHPGTPFATAADCLTLVEAVDSPHLKLMLDLYHAQIGEGNLIELIRRCGDADRGDPGRRRAGPLRARHRRDQLPGDRPGPRRLGYTGVVGLEAFASSDSDLALERFRTAFTV